MAFEFKLPDIGEGITEGEIVKWLVAVGDTVKEDQPVIEIMTDKATVEIASPKAGTISQLSAKEGESVKVGSTIVVIQEAGTAATAAPTVVAPMSVPTSTVSASQATPAAVALQASVPSFSNTSGLVLASPATRKLARENGLDLASVVASGPHGRVLKTDIENVISGANMMSSAPAVIPTFSASSAPAASAALSVAPKFEPKVYAPAGSEERIPLRGVRKKIAENMLRAKLKAAHFTHVDEGDMTQLVAIREQLKDAAATSGVKLTYLPFLVKAVCAALKEFPRLNSTLDEDKQEIVVKHFYNIGIAVATADDDLIVPVIKNADQKSILEIAREIVSLAEKARTNKLASSDLQGGTFTITSLGNMAGTFATPIINYPEVGILGFYKIEDKPVVRNGQVVVRKMAHASITLDHRLVDGAMGARFMKAFMSYMETPTKLLLGS